MNPRNMFCGRTRREFLWQAGGGFTSLGLVDALSKDGFFDKLGGDDPAAGPLAPKPPHHAPKAPHATIRRATRLRWAGGDGAAREHEHSSQHREASKLLDDREGDVHAAKRRGRQLGAIQD